MMTTFSVKNWDQFQHYKTGKNAARRPEWIRLYTRLLDDIEFHELSGDDAKALVMLWALASEKDGELPSIKAMAFRLRLAEQKLTQILGRLSHWIDGNPSQILGQIREEKEEIREEQEERRERRARASENEFLQTFWPHYPHKVGKAAAAKAYETARQKASAQEINDGVDRYIASKPPDRSWCNPATFLNQERWLDQPAPVSLGPPPRLSRSRQAGEELLEEIRNGKFNGNGGPGLRDEGSNDARVQLSKPSARPESVSSPTGDPVHREVEILTPGDDAPSNWPRFGMPVPHRGSG